MQNFPQENSVFCCQNIFPDACTIKIKRMRRLICVCAGRTCHFAGIAVLQLNCYTHNIKKQQQKKTKHGNIPYFQNAFPKLNPGPAEPRYVLPLQTV